MYASRIRAAALAILGTVGLSACATPYGSGVSVGIGNGGYYSPYGYGYSPYRYGSYGYGYPYGSRLGYGYGYPFGHGLGYGYGYPFGWYNDFYYPGTGIYVISRDGRRYRWTEAQRRYWEAKRQALRNRVVVRERVIVQPRQVNRRNVREELREERRAERRQRGPRTRRISRD